jgi:hypothetical protein
LRPRDAQADAARARSLFAWMVMRGLTEYPGAFVARLVTDAPTPFVLSGHTLAEIHARLPPGKALTASTTSPPAHLVSTAVSHRRHDRAGAASSRSSAQRVFGVTPNPEVLNYEHRATIALLSTARKADRDLDV